MERYRYIAKRLLTAIPTFLGITILVYVVASLAPSSPLEILFNDPYATAEEMARKSKELGLDQPVIIQYIRWLVQLVQGNMGMSIRTNGQVLDMILERDRAHADSYGKRHGPDHYHCPAPGNHVGL